MKNIRVQRLLTLITMLLLWPFAGHISAQNSTCDITIVMHDSWGDGWTGNSLGIYQGQTLLGSCTLANGHIGYRTIEVANNDSVRLVLNLGNYPDECWIDVLNANGDTILRNTQIYGHAQGETVVSFLNVCPDCIRPSQVTIDELNASSILFSWEGTGLSYQIECGPQGFTPGSGSTYSVSGTSYSIFGLEPNTAYDLYLKTLCSTGNSPATKLEFTTPYDCTPISSMNISEIGLVSAVVSFNPAYGIADNDASSFYITITDSNGYQVQYTTSDTTMPLEDLQPSTHYTVSVRPDCHTSTSWSTDFTTLALPCLVPDTSVHHVASIGHGTHTIEGVPVSYNYNSSFAQSLYRASDLTQAGALAGLIDSIYLNWYVANPARRQLTILLGQTTESQVSTSSWIGLDNATVVYSGVHAAGTHNEQGYKLTAPFNWDGVNNLVLSVIMSNTADTVADANETLAMSSSVDYPATSYFREDTDSSLTVARLGSTHPVGSTAYLPNIRLVTYGCTQSFECAAPILRVDYIDATEVALSWTPGYQENEWTVEYQVAGASTWTMAENSTFGSYYTFDNLNVNTDYNFRIGSICADTILYSIISAHTECGSISTLPYSQDFESCASDLPLCYTKADADPNEAQTDVIYYASRLVEMLSFGAEAAFMMPEIDEAFDMNNLQIAFTARVNSSYWEFGSDLIVGISDVKGDISSFTPVDTIFGLTQPISNHLVSFANYQGNGRFITFVSKPLGNEMANLVAVDNLLLTELPNCPPATGLAIQSLTSTTATITWQSGGNADLWVVECHTANGTQLTTSTPSETCTLANLAPGTTYQVSVHADCGGDSSEHASMSFTTLTSDPDMLPVSYTFEDDSHWTMVHDGQANHWVISTATSHGGSHALYVSDNNGSSNTYNTNSASVSYAYRDIVAPDSGWYYYAYDWLCRGEASYDYMRLYLAPAGTSLQAGVKVNGIGHSLTPAGWISLSGNNPTNQQDWTYRFDSIHLSNAGLYRLVAVWVNDDDSGNQPPAAIDNLVITNSPCMAPASFSANANAAGDSVLLSWSEVSASSTYQVCYAPSGANIYTHGTFLNGITGNSLAIGGIEQGERFDFYLRNACGNDSSNWRGPISVLTGPIHLMASTGTDTLQVCTATIFDNGGPNGNYSSDAQSILYLMPADTNSVLSISGSSHTEGTYDYLVIYEGYGTNGTILFSDYGISAPTAFGPFIADNGGFTLMFHSDGSREYSGFEISTRCIDNSCPVPTNLAATHATPNSVELSWTEQGNASQWIVEYGTPGFTLGQGTQVPATTNHLTIDLPSNYLGEFYVRSVCQPGVDTGRYNAHPCPFRTSQQPATIPYACDFDNIQEWRLWETASSTCYMWTRLSNTMAVVRNSTSTDQGFGNVFAYRDIDFGSADTMAHLSFSANLSLCHSASEEGLSVLLVDPTTPVEPSSTAYTTPWGSLSHLTPIAQISPNSGWTNYSIDLPNVSGIKRLVFYRYDISAPDTAFTVAIDSILIDFNHCATPHDLQASNVSNTAATISWSADLGNTFDIAYRHDGQAYASHATSQSLQVLLENLEPNTTYHVWVRSLCQGENSRYSDTLDFTTEPMPCTMPTGLTVSSVGEHNATINWSADEWISSFEVSYGAYGTAADQGTIVTASTNTFNIIGLQSNTNYQAYVRAVCDGVRSEWTDPVQFSTLAPDGIDDVSGSCSLNLYPNPASGSTTISLLGIEGTVTISLIDANGRTLQSETLSCSGNCAKALEVDHLAQGTYFVKVVADGISSVRRLIVK